jgi:hypothetical protein
MQLIRRKPGADDADPSKYYRGEYRHLIAAVDVARREVGESSGFREQIEWLISSPQRLAMS